MTRPLSRPSATAARIQARADKGRAWQEIQELWEKGEKARDEYAAHPIITKSYECSTCTGYAYGISGVCFDCVRERHCRCLARLKDPRGLQAVTARQEVVRVTRDKEEA